MHPTPPSCHTTDFPALHRRRVTTLQVNLGYRCNQSCTHCHVGAGPRRTEMMDEGELRLIPEVLAARRIATLDLTGGAPELHPAFRKLVRAARALGVRVTDRCNLTVLFEPGQESLAAFLAEQGVDIVASLPCYEPDNVDRQRGKGVFEKSIAGLRRLNALGYGQAGTGLSLNLVYNPQGAALPPDQAGLLADYRRELSARFGIVFNELFTIANMPIKRFGATLIATHRFNDYMRLLKGSFRASNLDLVMCRELVSVDWQGYLYDCDFNQQLGLPMIRRNGMMERPHLRDLLDDDPAGLPIRVADHCFGCTAGQGSGCGGALRATPSDGSLTGTSQNRRERPACKADGAQNPRHIMVIGEGSSTAQRRNRGAQQVSRGALTHGLTLAGGSDA